MNKNEESINEIKNENLIYEMVTLQNIKEKVISQ